MASRIAPLPRCADELSSTEPTREVEVASEAIPETRAVPIPVEEGRALPEEWSKPGMEVGVFYSVSHGQRVLTARGAVHLRGDLLRARCLSVLLRIWLGDAEFRRGPVTASGRGYAVGEVPDGLHVWTAHRDWLLLSSRLEPVPDAPTLPR
jgi:hypothetical protein